MMLILPVSCSLSRRLVSLPVSLCDLRPLAWPVTVRWLLMSGAGPGVGALGPPGAVELSTGRDVTSGNITLSLHV